MCWNAPVSFATFLVGSFINLGSYFVLRRQRNAKIIIYWQYALLMQPIEGVAWLQHDSGFDLRVISVFAFLFNVTQPIVLALVIRFGMDAPVQRAIVANIMYVTLLISERVWEDLDISPLPGCEHLELQYWNVSSTASYVFASLFSFLEIPDRVWAAVNMCIFLGSLLSAMLISSCGVGSLFCWLISISGIFLLFTERVRQFETGYCRV